MDKEAGKNYFVGMSPHQSYHRFQTWTDGYWSLPETGVSPWKRLNLMEEGDH